MIRGVPEFTPERGSTVLQMSMPCELRYCASARRPLPARFHARPGNHGHFAINNVGTLGDSLAHSFPPAQEAPSSVWGQR